MADKKYNLRPNTKFRLDHETCATCGVDEELEVIGTNKEFSISPQVQSASGRDQNIDLELQSGITTCLSHENDEIEQIDCPEEIKACRKSKETGGDAVTITQITSRSSDFLNNSQISAPIRPTTSIINSDLSNKTCILPSDKSVEHVHFDQSKGPMTEPSYMDSRSRPRSTSSYSNTRQMPTNIQENNSNMPHTYQEPNRANLGRPNAFMPQSYITSWGDSLQYEAGPVNSRNNLRPNYGQGDFTTPKVNLPTFNGKTDWEAFYVQFEFFCERYHWDPTEKMSQLMSSLRDVAIQYVARLPVVQRSSYDQLVDALKIRFGDHVLPETHRAALQTIKKNSKEELHEFASRVGDLVSKAYPGLAGSQLHTDLTIETMVNGLQDPSLVYDVLTKKPKSVREAVDMIAWHDCCKGASRRKSGIRQISDYADIDDHSIRRINDKKAVTEERLNSFGRGLQESILDMIKNYMENPRRKPQISNSKRNNFVRKEPALCFKCNSPDHLIAKCPQNYKSRIASVPDESTADTSGVPTSNAQLN